MIAALFVCSSFIATEHRTVADSSKKEICEGRGYTVAYTVRDNQVCEGRGYTVVYTIRGNEICKGRGYEVAYTVR